MVILLVSVILWIVLKKKEETEMKVRQIENQVVVFQRRGVTLVASDMIPGYEIKEVIDTITGDSEVDGSKRFGVRVAELEALTLIMYIALSQGADAITCFKMSTGNHRPDSKADGLQGSLIRDSGKGQENAEPKRTETNIISNGG